MLKNNFKIGWPSSLVLPLLLAVLGTPLVTNSACAIGHPCKEGGDISWPNPIQGDKKCYQKKDKDGIYRNDGKFSQWHSNGQLALEGQFKKGKKEGLWIQFDETGKKVAERRYQDGVELSSSGTAPAPQEGK